MSTQTTTEDEKVLIPEAPEAVTAVCEKIFATLKNKGSMLQACKKNNIGVEWFLSQCSTYENLYRKATRLGVKLTCPTPAKTKSPEGSSIPEDLAVSPKKLAEQKMLDTPKGFDPFIPNKDQAVQIILMMMSKGASFRTAVSRSGARESNIKMWCIQEPDLIRQFKKAEGMWAERFYDSLNKAIDVAASKGNLKDLLEVADRRFPEWCAVEKVSREAAARLKGEEEVEVQIGAKELTSTTQSEQKQGIQIFIEGEVINEEET